VFLGLALVAAVTAWILPARWRSVHPAVLRAAGQGTSGLVEVALLAAKQQRAGLADLLNQAATELALAGTNEVTAALATRSDWSPDVVLLGGPDGAVSTLLSPLAAVPTNHQASALEIFLPAAHRAKLRARLGESRSPGVQALLKTLNLPTQQFVPANQPGGQPLEAVILLTATLYERERLSATFLREVRELAEQAPTDAVSRQRLEEFYLNLLSISRRLDWTSLAELIRKAPGIAAFEQFAATVRTYPNDLPLLYSSALLSGEVAGVASHLATYGDVGRQGLSQALRDGAGAVLLVGRQGRPVRPGLECPKELARAVFQAPQAWAVGRSALFFAASILSALSLSAFAQVGLPESASTRPNGALSLVLISLLLGGFLVFASEPLPSRPLPQAAPKLFLDAGALTKSSDVANSSHPRKNIMEPTTLVTLVIFGAIQLAVYVICVRKISEISNLPEPPSVRLRLLENEENLFDSGLYVGIGGTAAALMMQVLQMVEANLLAAYSSNLMGIICVALVKIGHVRHARRRLILESQMAADIAAASPAPGQVAVPNTFTFR